MIRKFRYIFNRREKWSLLGILFMMSVGSLLELGAVAIFSPYINLLIDPEYMYRYEGRNLRTLYEFLRMRDFRSFIVFLSVAIATIYVAKNVYLMLQQNAILKFGYEVRRKLAVRLLTTYIKEPYSFHRQKNAAQMTRCLQSDTNQFMTLINSILQILIEMFVCLTLAAYLFHTSHLITIIVGGLMGGCVFGFAYISKNVSSKLGRANEIYNAKMYQWINQSLGGIKEIKVLERGDFFIDAYSENYTKLIKGAKNNELLAAYPKHMIESVSIVGMIIAIIGKLFFGQTDEFTTFVPQIAIFAVAAFRLMPSAGKINAYFSQMMYSKAALDMIYNDLKEVENFKIEEEDSKHIEANWVFETQITVKDVDYHYPDSDELVLNHANITIEKGQTIALIGASGSGKTTMADLVMGLLDPSAGAIYMDQHEIHEDMKAWHRKLGYIPQSIYLCDDTIRNNVALGIVETDIDDAAVWKALEMAQLADFVSGLEQGLDTMVGDRGTRLSGGQRQRIGIARALYHDPEILVLDEATSALDNETETAVMEAIDSLQGLKTMIIIAHRLTTIKNADVIYEVGGGVATIKSHEEIGL